MKIGILFFALFGLFVFSCSETNEFEPESEFDITGYWINQQFNDTVFEYQKSASLKEGQYCFGFKEDGEFIERKNSGWCGTPPINYGDFEGVWSINDSTLEISVEFWGGMADYKWKIISLDNQQLSLIQLESNHEFKE